MPFSTPTLSDWLRPRGRDRRWFVRRKHEDKWYYLQDVNGDGISVIWTTNKEQGIPFTEEKTAQDVVKELEYRSSDLDLSYESMT